MDMGSWRTRRTERDRANELEAEAVSRWLAEMSEASDGIFGATGWHSADEGDVRSS
jgi:hypothetical protein